MFARLLILLYAIVSYAVFSVSFALCDRLRRQFCRAQVNRHVGRRRRSCECEAIVVNLLLLACLPSSTASWRARPSSAGGRASSRRPAERSTYVLLSSLILLLLFWQWRPIPAPIWQVEGIAAVAAHRRLLAGLADRVASTLHDRSFRAVRPAPGVRRAARSRDTRPIVQDAAALPGGAASADAGLPARVLGHAAR